MRALLLRRAAAEAHEDERGSERERQQSRAALAATGVKLATGGVKVRRESRVTEDRERKESERAGCRTAPARDDAAGALSRARG